MTLRKDLIRTMNATIHPFVYQNDGIHDAADAILALLRERLTSVDAVDAACRGRFGDVWDRPTTIGPTEIGRNRLRTAMRADITAALNAITGDDDA